MSKEPEFPSSVFMRVTALPEVRMDWGLGDAVIGDKYVFVVKGVDGDQIDFCLERVSEVTT